MSVKYWILVLGLGSAMLCRATGTDAAFLQEEGHIQVALRAIGHELLLSIGDSTSRVLPVQQEGNRYKIPFATAFQLDPAQLTKLVKEVTATIAFPQDYIVEVEACNALEIVYAYEIRGHSSSDLIPCQGRALPNDCYNLVFTFPETPAGNTVEEMDHGQVLIDWKYAGWLLLILVLAGAIAYFRYRQPSLQKVAAEQRPLGSYHFSPATMELSRQGQVTPLTAKEAELLALLHDHANETLERDLLLKTVWGNEDSYVGRTLDVFITRLRRKLEDDPTVKIANIRGVGYKLVLAR